MASRKYIDTEYIKKLLADKIFFVPLKCLLYIIQFSFLPEYPVLQYNILFYDYGVIKLFRIGLCSHSTLEVRELHHGLAHNMFINHIKQHSVSLTLTNGLWT